MKTLTKILRFRLPDEMINCWSDQNYILNSPEYRQKLSDRMSKMQASGKLNKNYSRTKSGTVEIGGKQHFYRSSWEVNIAAYFEFLKVNGNIKEWQYEPTVFWFENIKRGVRSYKPDFLITENNDNQYYVEVKGWMDAKSKTKLNRMRIYYPEVRIDLICQKRYKVISKSASLIPHWGDLDTNSIEFKQCSITDCTNKSYSKDLCRKHFYKVFKK